MMVLKLCRRKFVQLENIQNLNLFRLQRGLKFSGQVWVGLTAQLVVEFGISRVENFPLAIAV